MSDDLLTLRALVVSPAGAERALLRQGAAQASVPLEIVEADGAGKACAVLDRDDIDLVLLDSALPERDQIRITQSARGLRKPAFVILLCDGADAQGSDSTRADCAATRPANAGEAQKLIDRCGRSRLGFRVLLVDDSSTMRGIVRKILVATRFQLDIAEAVDGNAAVEQIGKAGAQVVFLDYNMPGRDGLEILSELKRARPDAQVVIMTSTQDSAVAERARKAGAYAFLKKPFYPSDVDVLLHGLFGLVPLKPKA